MIKLVFCLLSFQQVEIGSFVNITFRSPVSFFPEQTPRHYEGNNFNTINWYDITQLDAVVFLSLCFEIYEERNGM